MGSPVASLAAEKDAQAMADFLRQHGYDAYVMTVQLASKTCIGFRNRALWFDLEAANQLRNSLASSADFKRAYVAAIRRRAVILLVLPSRACGSSRSRRRWTAGRLFYSLNRVQAVSSARQEPVVYSRIFLIDIRLL